MKTASKILLSFMVLAVTLLSHSNAQAQTDSSQIQITLSAKHHAFIVSLMPSKSQVDEIRYITQVANAMEVAADSARTVDTAQQITVIVSTDLVKRLYLVIGSQQERLASNINAEIKEALLPQLLTRPQLLGDIYVIAMKNASETEFLVQNGIKYLKALKL